MENPVHNKLTGQQQQTTTRKRDKRTRHIFDINLLHCLFLWVVFFLWRHTFQRDKESKFVEKRQQNWRGEESIDDNKKKMYYLREKRWQKCRHHTHVFLVLFPLYWLRHLPLLLFFFPSVCFLFSVCFSHKINTHKMFSTPSTQQKNKIFFFYIWQGKFYSISHVSGLFIW